MKGKITYFRLAKVAGKVLSCLSTFRNKRSNANYCSASVISRNRWRRRVRRRHERLQSLPAAAQLGPPPQRRAPREEHPAPASDHQAALLDRCHLLPVLAATQPAERRHRLHRRLRHLQRRRLLRRLRRLPRPGHVQRLRQPGHLRVPQRELQQGVHRHRALVGGEAQAGQMLGKVSAVRSQGTQTMLTRILTLFLSLFFFSRADGDPLPWSPEYGS